MQGHSLKEAISLYKAGNKKSASEILKNLVIQNPKDEAAWLWLSACLENTDQKVFCPKKGLEINPDNRNAKIALQQLTGSNFPEVEQIVVKPKESQKPTNPKLPTSQPARPAKQKKKRNRFVTFLAFLGFLVLVFACVLSVSDNQTSTQQTINIQSTTHQPTEVKSLIVKAGTLSQYENQFSKYTDVNVYKKDGTLDDREDDLKELCLDWLFYRAKILAYDSAGNLEKADEARVSFNRTNQWLDDYNEEDVQTMFSIIEKNQWSNW